jgi:hypothetical protein
LAAKGETQEFALFSGPRLERVVALDSIALIGDASHPLSGAFGAGAGFALEDVRVRESKLRWSCMTEPDRHITAICMMCWIGMAMLLRGLLQKVYQWMKKLQQE